MKHFHFSKKAVPILLSFAFFTVLCSCGGNNDTQPSPDSSITSDDISSVLSGDTPDEPSAVAANVIPEGDKTALNAIKAVLLGEAEFFSADANKNLMISQLNQIINPELTVDATSFSVADIGYNSTPAVVLSLNVEGNLYGFAVLSYQDGVVYGYTFSQRQFGDLRTDGTFVSSGGAGDVGINTITFDKSTYTIDKFPYCESYTNADGSWGELYFVNHQSATEEEYSAAFSQWQTTPYVTWVDFTPANVEAKLS